MVEELLPRSISAILISDYLVILAAYRMMRDGLIPSNRAFMRKVLSGTDKGVMGQLLENLAQWSVQSRSYMRHPTAFYHLLGKEDNLFLYQGADSELIYEDQGNVGDDIGNEEGGSNGLGNGNNIPGI